MEVCSSLLATIMEIFRNTRQVPWFTRWMNRLKSSHCTRPCKLEVHLALSTFLSLINISLPWLIIGMVRTNLTLSSSNGTDGGLWCFKNYQQKELHTSRSSLKVEKNISQWQIIMMEVADIFVGLKEHFNCFVFRVLLTWSIRCRDKSSRRTNSMTFNMAGKFVICYLLRNLEISTICMIWLLNLKNVRLEMFSRSSRRDSEISISYSGKFDR